MIKCPHCTVSFHDAWREVDFQQDGMRNFRVNSTICPSCRGLVVDLRLYESTGQAIHRRSSERIYPKGSARPPVASEVEEPLRSDYTEVQRTRRPLVITQQGRSAAVLLAVSEYEKLLAKVELLQDIHAGEHQIDSGQGITHSAARKRALERRRHGKQRLPLKEIK